MDDILKNSMFENTLMLFLFPFNVFAMPPAEPECITLSPSASPGAKSVGSKDVTPSRQRIALSSSTSRSYPEVKQVDICDLAVKDSLKRAADIARAWRVAKGERSTKATTRSTPAYSNRRNSDSRLDMSAAQSSSSPTVTTRPKTLSRPPSLSSFRSMMAGGRSTSALADDQGSPRPYFDSRPSFNTLTAISRAADPMDALSSPFDAMLHFLPHDTMHPNKNFQALLNEMLQPTIMLTTSALPIMNRQSMRSSSPPSARRPSASSMDLSRLALANAAVDTIIQPTIIHVLPDGCPDALPRVLDTFLSSLLPPLSDGLKGYILSDRAFSQPVRLGRSDEKGLDALQILLSSGLSCASPPSSRITVETRQAITPRPKAFVDDFANCRFRGLSSAFTPPGRKSSPLSAVCRVGSSDDSLPSLETGCSEVQLEASDCRSSDELEGAPPLDRAGPSSQDKSGSSTSSLPVTPESDSRRLSLAPVGHQDMPSQHSIPVSSTETPKKSWFRKMFGVNKQKQ
jgi:hypothetical protein